MAIALRPHGKQRDAGGLSVSWRFAHITPRPVANNLSDGPQPPSNMGDSMMNLSISLFRLHGTPVLKTDGKRRFYVSDSFTRECEVCDDIQFSFDPQLIDRVSRAVAAFNEEMARDQKSGSE